jgi:hypothetical protein
LKFGQEHEWWDFRQKWKNLLNNLRLVLQPFIFFNLIKPWLKVFSIPHLSIGFSTLIMLMNQLPGAIPQLSIHSDETAITANSC